MASKRTPILTAKGYVRSLGWCYREGRFTQPKFYLGHDRGQAELANLRLEQLWREIKITHRVAQRFFRDLDQKYEEQGGSPPVPRHPRRNGQPGTTRRCRWAGPSPGGLTTFVVPRHPDMDDFLYAHHIAGLRLVHTAIALVPEDQTSYSQGVTKLAESCASLQRYAQAAGATFMASPGTRTPDAGQTLHAALDAYADHLRKFEKPDDSGWARTQVNQTLRLKQRHADQPLEKLDLQGVEALIDYWRHRPAAQRTGKPVSRLTARNQIRQLKDFFRWLHRHGGFAWRKPEGYEDIKCRISKTTADVAARSATLHVQTYTVEELRVLFRRATPLMRTLILLALNCGFAAAESGALRIGEIFLSERHPFADLLGIASTEADSWIRGLRPKTSVYGEFKLWPETVAYLSRAMARRRMIAAEGDVLLVSSRGMPLTAKTKGGNKSSRVRNAWENLLDSVSQGHPGFRRLPFKQLRKTAGDLVKQASDGEVAAVFLRHGKPVKTDDLADVYTNRPFAKVFAALESVRQEKLGPLFQE